MTAPAAWLDPAAGAPISPARERAAPSLELVAAARSGGPRARFVAMVVSLLVGGLLGLLLLNTVQARDAFALHNLKIEARVLADREQALLNDVESLRSPQHLAEQAIAMGMVQAGPPAFLRLPDGAILGAPVPAEAPVPEEPQ